MKIASRILLMLIIVSALGFGLSRSPIQSYEKPKESFGSADLPDLSYLKVVDLRVSTDFSPLIQVALFMPRGVPEESFVKDILATYEWANTKFRPIKCGSEYPPEIENCDLGRVEIFILFEDASVPAVSGGETETYRIAVLMGLDQLHITTLLNQGIVNFDQLMTFHEQTEQNTQGTGGVIRTAQGVVTFRGFKNMK